MEGGFFYKYLEPSATLSGIGFAPRTRLKVIKLVSDMVRHTRCPEDASPGHCFFSVWGSFPVSSLEDKRRPTGGKTL